MLAAGKIETILIGSSLVVLLLGLAIAVVFDRYIKKEHRKILLIVVALLVTVIAQNTGEYHLERYAASPIWRTLVAIYGYSVRPVVCIMFFYLIGKKDKIFYIGWALVAINALIYLTAIFSDVAFKINAENHFVRGPLGFSCHIVSGILLAYVLYLSVKECYRAKRADTAMPIFNLVIIITAIVVDSVFPLETAISCLTIAMVISTVFYYVWLHLRFVREHELALMEEHRNRVILSQIQPHFIYNTLFSIQNIEGNPEETKQAVNEFANFIRGNLAALDGKELIPFKSEMEYVKDYVSLQQRRFPGRYTVQYDIQDDNFPIPPLSVQILVENAMKHGINVRYEGGTIKIHSHRDKKYHVITVVDDGVGFNVEKLENSDRVGLRAVKNRLEYNLDGTLNVESEIGRGTKITMKIPCALPGRKARMM